MNMSANSAPSVTARLRGVYVEFSGRAALSDVDLDLLPGQLMTIAGPNGAGKTTLLEVVAGTRPLSSGTRTSTRAVAFVPQRTAVSDRLPLTVRDVVSVGVWGRIGRWRPMSSDAQVMVDDALERLDITGLSGMPFSALSGGQRQRTLLAQGLARRADLLLLDEPTTGLDVDSGKRIRAVMREETMRGVSVACVSHDPSVLDEADRVVRLEDGRIA